MPPGIRVRTLLPPGFTGMVLTLACLIQFFVSVLIDSRYEPSMRRTLYWIIWYPAVFWMLALLTTLVSFPKVMFRKRRERARWVSPDRGIARPPASGSSTTP